MRVCPPHAGAARDSCSRLWLWQRVLALLTIGSPQLRHRIRPVPGCRSSSGIQDATPAPQQLEEGAHVHAVRRRSTDASPASSAASVARAARRGPRARKQAVRREKDVRRCDGTGRSSRAPQRPPRRRPRRLPQQRQARFNVRQRHTRRRAPPRRALQSPCRRLVRGPSCRRRGRCAPKSRQDNGPSPPLDPVPLAVAERHETRRPPRSPRSGHAAVHHVVEARRPAAPRRPSPWRFIIIKQVRADAAEEVLAGLRIRKGRSRAPRVGRGGERDRRVAFSPLQRAAAAAAAARSRGFSWTRRARRRAAGNGGRHPPGAAFASPTRRGPHHNKFEAFAQLQFTERQSFRFSTSWYQPEGTKMASPGLLHDLDRGRAFHAADIQKTTARSSTRRPPEHVP